MSGERRLVALRLERWAAGPDAIVTGVGPRAARHATERLLAGGGVDAVINLGICGALEAGLTAGRLVVVRGWIDGPDADPQLTAEVERRLRAAGLGWLAGRALTVREPLITPRAKAAAHRESGARICEMEGRAIATVCAEAGVPVAALRVVADDVDTRLRRPPRMLGPLSRSLWALRRAAGALRS